MHRRFSLNELRLGSRPRRAESWRTRPPTRRRARIGISLGDWLDLFADRLAWLALAAGSLAFFCYVASGSYPTTSDFSAGERGRCDQDSEEG